MAARLMRVLVANRGEIACRVLRTLRTLGVPSVAVFTPPDAQAPHVWLADSSHGLPNSTDYLNGDLLISTARASGATAIHPGYGFLSQSPSFAQAVRAAGLVFIGPSSEAMATLGDKSRARQLAVRLGLPVIPGAEHVADAAAATAVAERLGLPLLIKAAGGGGGRGMRRIEHADQLTAQLSSAQREAQQFFGNGALLLERYIHPARHIEVQIMGDGRHTQVLGERECSLQRRYQKVLEEGPVTHLTAAQRVVLYDSAQKLGDALHYSGAGTVEFLLGPDGAVYFLEVNTRLQVEHPVTEMCTGLDLVAMQLQAAHGEALAPAMAGGHRGHAIELRLNAEDASRNFMPQTGCVDVLHLPSGPNVRVDSGVAEGSVVGGDYDPLLAKIIAWGPDRSRALATARQAIDELVLLGVTTNQAFLAALLGSDEVAQQQTFTTTVEARAWAPPAMPDCVAAVALAGHNETAATAGSLGAQGPSSSRRAGPWDVADSFRSVRP